MRSRSAIFLLAWIASYEASSQQLEWATRIGGTSQEVATATVVDSQGAVITVGYFVNTVDLDPGAGTFTVSTGGNSSDIYVQKLDPNGQFIWGAALGNTGADVATSVTVDGQDNIVLTGKISGTVDIDPGPGVFNVTTLNTTFDALVLKLSSAGNFLWGKIFGSNNNDSGFDVAVDGVDNIITTGVLGAAGDLDPGAGIVMAGGSGSDDVYLQKLDPLGNFIWGWSIGGTLSDIGHSLDVDGSGSIYVTGEYRSTIDLDPGPGALMASSAGDADIFVVKLDTAGTLIWGHAIGGSGFEVARSIAVSPAGDLAITGQLNSITDMDPGPGVAVLPGSFTEDAFLLKWNSSGAYQWAFLLKSFLNIGSDVLIDPMGDVITCGSFTGVLDIDPDTGVTHLTSNGARDAYLISYSPTGQLQWGFNIGGSQNDMANGAALDPSGPLILTGEFLGIMDADPGPGVENLVSAGGQDAFTIKYGRIGCETVRVSMKAWLDGAYRAADQLMVDSLRVRGLLPLLEPYSAMGYAMTSPMPTSNSVLGISGNDAIVDWVMLEIRDDALPSNIIEARAALIQRDGDVVDVDGSSPVAFCDPGSNVRIALRHRNHLGVMTDASHALSNIPTTIDLTLASTAVFGVDARKDLGGARSLWPGNVLPDDQIKYTGLDNDRDPILQAVGGVVPTAFITDYAGEDVNLDGTVKYTGAVNDRDIILQTIGGSVPTAVRDEQLP